jgi:hypothetical protein
MDYAAPRAGPLRFSPAGCDSRLADQEIAITSHHATKLRDLRIRDLYIVAGGFLISIIKLGTSHARTDRIPFSSMIITVTVGALQMGQIRPWCNKVAHRAMPMPADQCIWHRPS